MAYGQAKPALGYPSLTQAVAALHGEGVEMAEIARRLGRSEKDVAALWANTARRSLAGKEGKVRRCLCCGQRFASAGAHNRLCKSCGQRDGGGDYRCHAEGFG